MKNLYLVPGVKYYPAYEGDTASEHIKVIVPASSEEEAEQRALDSEKIDEVTDNTRILYLLKNEDFADIIYTV
jgi:hypothetical protein